MTQDRSNSFKQNIRQNKERIEEYADFVRNHYKPLTKQEELEAAALWKENGDTKARDKVICGNLFYVVKYAHKYVGFAYNPDDLIQEGNAALLKALDKFEPERGYRFGTYAIHWINAYMKMFCMKNDEIVRKFSTQHDARKLFFKLGYVQQIVHETNPDIKNELRRKLSFDTNIPIEKIKEVEHRYHDRCLSGDMDIKNSSDNKYENLTLINTLKSSSDIENEYCKNVELKNLFNKVVRNHLTELSTRDKDIIHSYIFEGKTLSSISEKYNLSRERIRQVKEKALSNIKKDIATNNKQLHDDLSEMFS